MQEFITTSYQFVFLNITLYCSIVSLHVFSDLSACNRDLQAAEDEAGPGGFKSGPHPGPFVFLRYLSEGLCSPK